MYVINLVKEIRGCGKRSEILNFHLDDSRQGGAEDFLCLFMRCESRSGNSIIRIPWPTLGLLRHRAIAIS